jgi:WD40 repeat protein
MAFSPDGQTFLSGSADGSLRLWSLGPGTEIQRFKDHEGLLRSVAFSPDGRTALSVEDSVLHHWDLETGDEILRIDLPYGGLEMTYTPDGLSALVTTLEGGDTLQFDLTTGVQIQRLGGEDELSGHPSSWPVMGIAVSPDGKRAFSSSQASERTLFLWDLESGEELMAFEDSYVFGVDISPDGQTALSVNSDAMVTLWDLTTGEAIRQFEGHDGVVWGVAYSPDGKTAITASWDSTLILWDLESGEILHRFLGHSDQVRKVAISPDGRTAISSSRDGTLILWDLETGEALRRYRGHDGMVLDVAFSPDGETILSGGLFDGQMIQWRIDDSLQELINWTQANRSLRELTCSEREQFNIEPLWE